MNRRANSVPAEQAYDILMKILDKQLTERQKCYIIMYYKEGLPMRRIAEICEVNPSTVSRTIKRANQKLELIRKAADGISGV